MHSAGRQLAGVSLLTLCSVVAGAACDEARDGPARVSAVRVDPPAAQIAVGESQAFEATATFSDATTRNVTRDCDWSSADETVATIDAAGVAEAVGAGTADVACTFDRMVGAATLTVAETALLGIVIRPSSATIAPGDTAGFRAVVEWDDGTETDVTDGSTWHSANETIAAVAVGTVTGLSDGSTTITARWAGEQSDPATVTVRSDVAPERIRIVPEHAEIPVGGVAPFAALLLWSDGRETDVSEEAIWHSSDPEVATLGADRLAMGLAPGTATITAERLGLRSSGATVTVRGPDLLAISLDPPALSWCPGSRATASLTAAGRHADGSTVDLTELATWASDDETIATVSNERGSRGVVAARATVPGTARITATYDGITSSPTVVSVPDCDAVERVDVRPATVVIGCGESAGLVATATWAFGLVADVTASADWTSSDAGVATVDAVGVVTGVASGEATITATFGASGTASVTVGCDTILGIIVTPSATTLPVGLTQQFTATAIYPDRSTSDVTASPYLTWTSSMPSVAAISNEVGAQGLATALSTGATSITARYADRFVDVVSPGVALSVTSCPVIGLTIVPSSATIAVGTTMALRAQANRSCGLVEDVSDGVTWASADETVATVATGAAPRGVVTGVRPGGPVRITATGYGVPDAVADVSVVPP